MRTPGFAGADLANLLNEAAILAGRRGLTGIRNQEIDDAVDRIVAGMEGKPLTDGKAKQLVAYHEVGHAICGTLTPGHDPVQKVRPCCAAPAAPPRAPARSTFTHKRLSWGFAAWLLANRLILNPPPPCPTYFAPQVTLIPRGQARGLTWFVPGEDPTLISKHQIFARIVGALGGRAAEEVIFGEAEVGRAAA
jgi:cell division protease FtsH